MKGRFDMPKGTNPEIPSIEEIQTKYGVKAVPGKLSGAKGKYTLVYGGKRVSLDPKLLTSEQPVEKTIKGTIDVAVIANAKGVFVIIVTLPKLPRKPIIVCYKPIPDFMRRIDPKIRLAIAHEVLIDSGLPDPVQKTIINNMPRGLL
jgi:hypothetical protein